MPAAAEPTSTVQNQSTRQQMRQARGGIGKHVGSTFRKGWTRNRLRDGLRAGGSRRGDETKRSARRREEWRAGLTCRWRWRWQGTKPSKCGVKDLLYEYLAM